MPSGGEGVLDRRHLTLNLPKNVAGEEKNPNQYRYLILAEGLKELVFRRMFGFVQGLDRRFGFALFEIG